MRIKSKLEGAFIEPWQTPIMNEMHVGLQGILSTQWYIHFCFKILHSKDINVLTVPACYVYRVMEEEHAMFLDKYFDIDLPNEPSTVHKPKYFKTWKLWGTQLIKDMDEGYALSKYNFERDKDIFQYLIRTQNEWIEIIAPNPEWRVFRGSNFKKVCNYYLKRDMKRFWKL